MTNEFPKNNIGVVRGIDVEYDVHWVDQDLAVLAVDGDIEAEFASTASGGFVDEADVLDQAGDIVAEWDEEALYGEEV